MKITATQKFTRTSPRKIRQVASSIGHLSPDEALIQLNAITNRPSILLSKTIKQAIANASGNLNLDPKNLKLSSIEINPGPTYKRWRAVSRGRSHSIFKRTSHVKITLETITDSQKQLTPKKPSTKPLPDTKSTASKPTPSSIKTTQPVRQITTPQPTPSLPTKKNIQRQKKV